MRPTPASAFRHSCFARSCFPLITQRCALGPSLNRWKGAESRLKSNDFSEQVVNSTLPKDALDTRNSVNYHTEPCVG